MISSLLPQCSEFLSTDLWRYRVGVQLRQTIFPERLKREHVHISLKIHRYIFLLVSNRCYYQQPVNVVVDVFLVTTYRQKPNKHLTAILFASNTNFALMLTYVQLFICLLVLRFNLLHSIVNSNREWFWKRYIVAILVLPAQEDKE